MIQMLMPRWKLQSCRTLIDTCTNRVKETDKSRSTSWIGGKQGNQPTRFYHRLREHCWELRVSSGAIELDIGVGGNFVTKEMLSMSTVALEMKLFVKRNYHIMDWNKIIGIPDDDIEAYLPHPPQIPLVAQEYNENGQHQDYMHDLDD